MSWRAVSWAIEQRTGSGPRKSVLLALAHHANEDDVAWPSAAMLAAETELSHRTVQRVLADLAAADLILVEEPAKRTAKGLYTAVRYRLPLRQTDAPIGTSESRSVTGTQRQSVVDATSESRGSLRQGDVVRTVKKNGREEPKEEETPAPPASSSPKKKSEQERERARALLMEHLPESYRGEPVEQLLRFYDYRRQRKSPMTLDENGAVVEMCRRIVRGRKGQYGTDPIPPDLVEQAVSEAIEGGWSRLFCPKIRRPETAPTPGQRQLRGMPRFILDQIENQSTERASTDPRSDGD